MCVHSCLSRVRILFGDCLRDRRVMACDAAFMRYRGASMPRDWCGDLHQRLERCYDLNEECIMTGPRDCLVESDIKRNNSAQIISIV